MFSLEPHSVVKVHIHADRFELELAAYQRLKEHGVTEVACCSVPELLGFDRIRKIIEIAYVKPPFIIDFGKSRLDDAVDFRPDAWDMWEQTIQYNFGQKAGWAFLAHKQLRDKYGIHHDDVTVSNFNFGDKPATREAADDP